MCECACVFLWKSTDFHGFNPWISADFHGLNPWISTDFHGLNPWISADFHGLNPWISTDFHGLNPWISTDFHGRRAYRANPHCFLRQFFWRPCNPGRVDRNPTTHVMAHCLVQRKKIACGAQVGLYMYNVPPPRWVTRRLTLMSQPYLVEIILTFM